MKFILVATLSLLSLSSFANHEHHKMMEKKMDAMSFEDAKKMKLEMMDKKSMMMEKEKQCVTAAKDKPALKECMKEMWKEHEAMESSMNSMKEKHKK